MRRLLIGLLIGVVVLGAAPAAATPDRISYGEVRSHFQAGFQGGRAILFNTPGGTPAVVNAGPASFFDGGIRPFPDAPWDGASYCEDDWHVFLLGIFAGGDSSYTHEDAVSDLESIDFEFVLDGTVISDTERTALKRFLAPEGFGLERAFSYQKGAFVAPGTLAVGGHTLAFDLGDGFPLGITLNVDASGTGACL